MAEFQKGAQGMLMQSLVKDKKDAFMKNQIKKFVSELTEPEALNIESFLTGLQKWQVKIV